MTGAAVLVAAVQEDGVVRRAEVKIGAPAWLLPRACVDSVPEPHCMEEPPAGWPSHAGVASAAVSNLEPWAV